MLKLCHPLEISPTTGERAAAPFDAGRGRRGGVGAGVQRRRQGPALVAGRGAAALVRRLCLVAVARGVGQRAHVAHRRRGGRRRRRRRPGRRRSVDHGRPPRRPRRPRRRQQSRVDGPGRRPLLVVVVVRFLRRVDALARPPAPLQHGRGQSNSSFPSL